MAGRLVSVRTDTRNEINAERLSNIYIYIFMHHVRPPCPQAHRTIPEVRRTQIAGFKGRVIGLALAKLRGEVGQTYATIQGVLKLVAVSAGVHVLV